MSRGAVVCPTGTALVSRARVAWFFGLFLVSGFCSLVYEVVWLRLAMASFGVTTPLVSIVLSVFMAGLALGSWAVGRLSRRFEARSPGFPLTRRPLTERRGKQPSPIVAGQPLASGGLLELAVPALPD